MMKRFGVNIQRIITVEQTVYVKATDDWSADKKVRDFYDSGKAGIPFVTFKGASGIFKDSKVEGQDINEVLSIEDCYEEEE